ncbi:MAG: hypothetical protein JF606_29470, partial [Burkholderiales bacterium]|nr:hypothetical protein [Burkholderiales bacterium]
MRQRIELQAEMGDAVLTHLRQFGELPTTGVVAGQAVASAIDDLWGRQGTGVYNDLDIFRHVQYRADIVIRRANATAARTNMGVVERESDYQRMSQMLALVDSYSIQSVNRDGMLNFVNCTLPAHLSGGGLSPTRVLAGFDLNCVRVAVDLHTKRLVWDRSFELYLASRQIEITMVHTPWHTFLRLLKKLEELPETYADVDAAAAICTGVAGSSFLAKLKSTARVSLLFGAKHKELADRNR